jgi:hypothetical protein
MDWNCIASPCSRIDAEDASGIRQNYRKDLPEVKVHSGFPIIEPFTLNNPGNEFVDADAKIDHHVRFQCEVMHARTQSGSAPRTSARAISE